MMRTSYLTESALMERGWVFVFGSNLAGRHGKGAALTAARHFGAIRGKGEGLYGKSYALPTKDKQLRALPLSEIKTHLETFFKCVEAHPRLTFYLTNIGCGLAGYSIKEIAPLIAEASGYKRYIPNLCFADEKMMDAVDKVNFLH